MSFEDIKILRSFPVIDDFVQIAPNTEIEKTKVTLEAALALIPGSKVIRLSLGSGRRWGLKSGQDELFQLPAILPNTWYTSDHIATLDNAAITPSGEVQISDIEITGANDPDVP